MRSLYSHEDSVARFTNRMATIRPNKPVCDRTVSHPDPVSARPTCFSAPTPAAEKPIPHNGEEVNSSTLAIHNEPRELSVKLLTSILFYHRAIGETRKGPE